MNNSYGLNHNNKIMEEYLKEALQVLEVITELVMKSKHILLAGLILAQLIYVNCFAWAVVGIATSALGTIINIIEKTKVWTVEVHNNGKHHAHMWCASKDDKIGGNNGIWVKPGDKIMWSFRRHRTTQFWCNMDWYGQRVGWDVFVNNWRDAPNPTKWSIRNDGVYDQWKNRKWRNLRS